MEQCNFTCKWKTESLKLRLKKMWENIKYNKKTTDLAKSYEKEPSQNNLNNNRIISSRFYLSFIIRESIEVAIRIYSMI